MSPPVERRAITRPRTWQMRAPTAALTAASAYLPSAPRASATSARSALTSSVSAPAARPATSFAKGFSPRSRTRLAFAMRASMMTCSAPCGGGLLGACGGSITFGGMGSLA